MQFKHYPGNPILLPNPAHEWGLLTRVLSRPADCVFEPREPWEYAGDVPHVVVSCATLRVGDELWIYYGGADRAIGQASCSMGEVIAYLEAG